MKKYLSIAVFVVLVALLSWWRLTKKSVSPTTNTTVVPTDTPMPLSTDTSQPLNTATPTSTVAPSATTSKWKDGTYTGSSEDAYYGNVQVQVTIRSGKITNVSFLDYPHDAGESVRINSRAVPLLQSEAIQAQSASVDGVSGASFTSRAFVPSLESALSQAGA